MATQAQNTWKLLKTAPPTAWFGMIMIAIYAMLAIFAPFFAPFGETEVVDVAGLGIGDSAKFLMGTDHIGRDVLSRIIYGARNTVGIAFLTTVLTFVDVLMAIPPLIFALLILTIVGTSVINMILVIAVLDATRVFRLARAVGMNIAVMDYVEVAKLRGEGLWWIIRHEILPNISAPLAAEFGLRFCFVFLFIASLSFLGLGLQPPTADWGSMVRDMSTLITFGLPTPLLPAAAVALLTVSVNFVVDWFLHKTSGLKT